MTRALLTLLFTATFVVSPAFTEPFSGFRADQLPIPQIDPPVQPAGYAFAIWGLIYSWLVVSAVFGLWQRSRSSDWDRVRDPLIVSLALGTPWLAVANTSALWATGLILLMALAAIAALLRAGVADRWWLRVPVAIFAGWLTAAFFVSLGSTAAGYGIVLSPTGWAYAGIALAAITALAVQRAVGDEPAYGLTVIWALAGIIASNGLSLPGVSLAAAAAMALLLTLIMRGVRRPA